VTTINVEDPWNAPRSSTAGFDWQAATDALANQFKTIRAMWPETWRVISQMLHDDERQKNSSFLANKMVEEVRCSSGKRVQKLLDIVEVAKVSGYAGTDNLDWLACALATIIEAGKRETAQ